MRIMLWGGRSKARIVLAMIEEIYKDKAEVVGIFDEFLLELPFEASVALYSDRSALENLCKQATHFVVCIGGEHGYARFHTAQKLKGRGIQPLSLISEHGLLDQPHYCGEGVQVMPGAVIHKFCSVGRQCILNTNSTVDHECKLGDGVHVMGGASIAGRVTIGDFSTIGTNATILPNLNIGRNVFVGAGAVVTRDIDDYAIVAGVPARFVRKNTSIFDCTIFDL